MSHNNDLNILNDWMNEINTHPNGSALLAATQERFRHFREMFDRLTKEAKRLGLSEIILLERVGKFFANPETPEEEVTMRLSFVADRLSEAKSLDNLSLDLIVQQAEELGQNDVPETIRSRVQQAIETAENLRVEALLRGREEAVSTGLPLTSRCRNRGR